MYTHEEREKIRKLVEYYCRHLEIEPCKVFFNNDDWFETPTTKAVFDLKDNIIHVKKDMKVDPELWFVLLHEIRHAYQSSIIGSDMLAQITRQPDGSLSVKSYNEQVAELDAHAWAYLMMKWDFGIEISFSGLPAETKNKILTRAKQISEQEYEIDEE